MHRDPASGQRGSGLQATSKFRAKCFHHSSLSESREHLDKRNTRVVSSREGSGRHTSGAGHSWGRGLGLLAGEPFLGARCRESQGSLASQNVQSTPQPQQRQGRGRPSRKTNRLRLRVTSRGRPIPFRNPENTDGGAVPGEMVHPEVPCLLVL